MGDRASISFSNGERESVTLFSHWGGLLFFKTAYDYAEDLKKWVKKNKRPGVSDPISRFDPETVMVDFIRELTKNQKHIESDLYLGKDQNDGDNSDNGHRVILISN